MRASVAREEASSAGQPPPPGTLWCPRRCGMAAKVASSRVFIAGAGVSQRKRRPLGCAREPLGTRRDARWAVRYLSLPATVTVELVHLVFCFIPFDLSSQSLSCSIFALTCFQLIIVMHRRTKT